MSLCVSNGNIGLAANSESAQYARAIFEEMHLSQTTARRLKLRKE